MSNHWSEPSPEWKARAAALIAQLTAIETASGCVEGPGHVIGALMALFGYKAKNYSRKTRIYLTPAKWALLGLRPVAKAETADDERRGGLFKDECF